MLTPTVVKHLDIVNEVITGCLTRPIIPLRRALALQAAKKPLRDRLVSTRPLATPAARHPRGRPHPAVGMAGILSTTITLVSQASTGLATAPRPLQGLTHPRRSERRAHRPPPTCLADRSTSPDGYHQPAAVQMSVTSPHHAPWGATPAPGRSRRCGATPSPGRLAVVCGPRRRRPATDTPACGMRRRAVPRPTASPASWRGVRRRRRPSLCAVCGASAVRRARRSISAPLSADTGWRLWSAYKPRRPPPHTSHRTATGQGCGWSAMHASCTATRGRKNGGPASRSHAPGATASPLCATAGVLRARRSGDRCRPCSRWCATRRDASSAPASWHCSPGCARLP